MPRLILEETHIHPSIRSEVADHQKTIVREVIAAVSSNDVVVVGMRFNPFPKKACKALDAIHQGHKYLEYGNYVSMWRERNALKLWSGWPTFPDGVCQGNFDWRCGQFEKANRQRRI